MTDRDPYRNVMQNGDCWRYCEDLTEAEQASRPVRALAQATLQAHALLSALEGWEPAHLDVPAVRQQMRDALLVAGHSGFTDRPTKEPAGGNPTGSR